MLVTLMVMVSMRLFSHPVMSMPKVFIFMNGTALQEVITMVLSLLLSVRQRLRYAVAMMGLVLEAIMNVSIFLILMVMVNRSSSQVYVVEAQGGH